MLRALDGSRALILMYHRVLPRGEAERRAVEPGMYVSPETFALHMTCLSERFCVVPLHEIVTAIRDQNPFPERACAITFDDGWRDNLEYALPVLEARSLPATIFVVADRVGTTGAFWPDEVSRRLSRIEEADRRRLGAELGISLSDGTVHGFLTQLKQVPEFDRLALIDRLRRSTIDLYGEERELLDWEELADLSRRGVDIESHGLSHAILTGTSRDQVERELSGSLEALKRQGHARYGLLAYPSGAYDDSVVRVARESGYQGAVTTRPGVANGDCDAMMLPRIGLHEDVSATRLEFLHRVVEAG